LRSTGASPQGIATDVQAVIAERDEAVAKLTAIEGILEAIVDARHAGKGE
jgi:hypothetical protein